MIKMTCFNDVNNSMAISMPTQVSCKAAKVNRVQQTAKTRNAFCVYHLNSALFSKQEAKTKLNSYVSSFLKRGHEMRNFRST